MGGMVGRYLPPVNTRSADAATLQQLRRAAAAPWGRLSERERLVLSLRFGLEDGPSRTLEEVGREFGLTREHIRRIEARALLKFRVPGWRLN